MSVPRAVAATAVESTPAARSIPAETLLREIKALGITHVLTVPDTHQKTLIEAIAQDESLQMLTICTEDEAVAINAGLYITGHKPMLLIQNNGLFACINALKAISLDAQVPTFMVIGQFGRDEKLPASENRSRMVRNLAPTLETWGIPYVTLEGPEDVPAFRQAYQASQEQNGPSAAIIGARTS